MQVGHPPEPRARRGNGGGLLGLLVASEPRTWPEQFIEKPTDTFFQTCPLSTQTNAPMYSGIMRKAPARALVGLGGSQPI